MSDLALEGLARERGSRSTLRNCLAVFPAREGPVITDEMVAQALADE